MTGGGGHTQLYSSLAFFTYANPTKHIHTLSITQTRNAVLYLKCNETHKHGAANLSGAAFVTN